MSTFHVYSNAKGDYEAIPEDFSIGALLLGGVWALAKRLFKVGAALVAVDALAVYAMRVGQQTGAATWVIIGLVAMLAGRAFIALRAAELREDSMPRRGFQFVATVNAMDTDTAISRAVREELSESERGPDATGSMRRVAAAPSAFVQDRPGTRSEFDIDALRGGDPDPSAARDQEGDAAGSDAAVPDRPRWEPPAARTGHDDSASVGADDDGDADPEDRSRRLRLAAIGAVALAIVAGAAYASWYFLVRTPSSPSGEDDEEVAAVMAPTSATDESVQDQPTDPTGAATASTPAATQATGPAVAATTPVASGAAAAPADSAGATPAASTSPGTTVDAVPPPKPRPLSPAEIEAAWSRHYKPAPKCVEPAEWDTYVECINTMMRQHDAFVTKYSQQSAEADAQAGKRP